MNLIYIYLLYCSERGRSMGGQNKFNAIVIFVNLKDWNSLGI